MTLYIELATHTVVDALYVMQSRYPASVGMGDWPDEWLAEWGFARVIPAEPPGFEEPYSVRGTAPVLINCDWVEQWEVVAPSLEEARQFASDRILRAFDNAKRQPVEHMGINWRGGFESAQAIGSYAQMIERTGGTTVQLNDDSGLPHAVPLETAYDIALAVGAVYQVVFSAKEAKLVAIREAATVEDVLAVDW